jgi:hypothetical protein
MRSWLPVVVIERNLVNIWGVMLALCLALLELSKAKGGPMTGLARVPGGAGEVRVARSVA